MDNYVVYHLHTELSLLDSCTNYKLYVDKAKELGQKAICFTEHGNCYHWIDKKMYCDANGIKYMHGVEIYLTETLVDENDKKIRDNYHTILIAKNYDGLREINTLIDLSTTPSHMYYKPRITFDEFKNISDNVIKISACLASPLNKLRDEELIQYYDYLEVQPHINSDEQIEYNKWLVEMSHKHNKPLIAGTDTHSLDSYKAECRSIYQKANRMEFSNEDLYDLTYKSYDELVSMFRQQNSMTEDDYMSAINNTNIMADIVEEFELDTSFKYPIMKDAENQFKQRINKMYADKVKQGIVPKSIEYKKRIQEEFRVFKKIGMISFMLFMSELISWCWENGIPIGFCRGSCGGSLIAYITDVIDVNPMVWRTVFSRFCNEDRVEIGDIDIDVSPSQRHLVYEYIIDRFGADKSAYILAIGTISDKGTIDEIGRALGQQWKGEPKDNPYSLANVAQIKKEYESNPEETKNKYRELFYYFDGLLGTAKSQSMHPAGIIASPVSLPDNYGTFWADGKRILSIDMEEVHEVSLVKYDILGLKNIEIIKDCCELAGIKYPKSHEINWNDDAVWDDMITSPVGIFQFESDYASKLLKEFKPHRINDMSIVNASLRPSGASYRDRLLSGEINKNPSKLIDDLLEENHGFLIFQEDTIAFLQNICGLSGSDADNIRRAIGRKQKDRLDKAMPSILEGYCKMSTQPREIAEQEAKAFLQIIEDSSNYQFGRNHSTGYSMIGYVCAMMRYYHPVEFITAYLNNANNEADIQAGTELARCKGVNILPPKFRYSKSTYQPDIENNAIYKGIGSIKFTSKTIAEQMYEMRDIAFDTFIDFLKQNPCDSRMTTILTKLGFFSEFGKSQYLLDIIDIYNKYYNRSTLNKNKCDIDKSIILKYSKETAKQYRITDSDGLLNELISYVENKNISLPEQLETESEYLGYIDYHNCKYKNYAYILNIDTRYSPKITMHLLDTGEIVTYKVASKLYQKQPFDKGSVIKYITEQRNKSTKVDGKWIKLEEQETWLVNYIVKNL